MTNMNTAPDQQRLICKLPA